MRDDPEILAEYYRIRAPAYDDVYARPERQADLLLLRRHVGSLLAGHDVLEIAAGTGYWTERIASTARSVHATDVDARPLDIAKDRDYPRSNVSFGPADAFAVDEIAGSFTACFAGFWWSHLKLADVDRFLHGVVTKLQPRGTVVLVDNRYVPGGSTPISRTDSAGNTYQRRTLTGGGGYEITKNFPSAGELIDAATGHGVEPRLIELEYFWLLTFRT